MRNPAVYEQLIQEIDTAAEEGQLSSPVKYSEAIKLPFLCACIKEALRVHPGVALTMARVVPTEGVELCGVYIAGGYRVGMNGAVLHYDQTIFGIDADQYRPGRWLEGDTANMDKNMLHFGAGTRTCIGKNISLAELHKLIPYLLRHFKFEMWEQDKPWTTRNLWFNKQEGLVVRVRRRQSQPK
jgi:cytochrome P450